MLKRIGKLECDFILRDMEQNYSYVQVAYTINESKQTAEEKRDKLHQYLRIHESG